MIFALTRSNLFSQLPDHFGRDEVVEILRAYYEGLTDKVEIKMHGAATANNNYAIL